MLFKKISGMLLLGFGFLIMPFSYAQQVGHIQQTLQIKTFFRSMVGKPTWLLVIRDMESGKVLPYMFDIRNNENYWIAFSTERSYRVTTSKLKFGPFAVINNFCGLQNGVIEGKSMFITLSGSLTPSASTSRCHVTMFNDSGFNFINSN